MVLALHGSLTAAEKALVQSPAGAIQLQEFHQQLFAHASATLLRMIKSITGMEVHKITAEIESATGSVVQVFTTATVGEEFLLKPGEPAGTKASTGCGTTLTSFARDGRLRLRFGDEVPYTSS